MMAFLQTTIDAFSQSVSSLANNLLDSSSVFSIKTWTINTVIIFNN